MSDQVERVKWWGWRNKKSGYADMGRIYIPMYGQIIQLTDRNDGSIWTLSFETNPVERVSISQDLSGLVKNQGSRLYDAISTGPTVDTAGNFTLFIRGGRLGMEYDAFPIMETFYSTQPTYARQMNDQRLLNTDSENPAVAHLGYVAP